MAYFAISWPVEVACSSGVAASRPTSVIRASCDEADALKGRDTEEALRRVKRERAGRQMHEEKVMMAVFAMDGVCGR